MFLALTMAAAALTAPTNLQVRDVLAAKFQAGVVLDLSSMHADPSSAATVCGQVVVNRHFSPIKFIVDIDRGAVWMESAPMNSGANTPLRDKIRGLVVGAYVQLEDAWRRCHSNGTNIPTDWTPCNRMPASVPPPGSIREHLGETSMGYRVAVVGATGNVGREMLNILEEVNFPVDEIHAVASRKSIGKEVSYGEKILKCKDVDTFDFSKVDVVLMSVSGAFSKEWSPKIAKQGPIVIDNSSAWRMDPDVPLIVPEVNPEAADLARKKGIIANPNCSTVQLVVALKPLHDEVKIKRVVVSTYQSVSGAGKEGMDELWNQTKAVYMLGATEPKKFPKQIAFNVIPFIGAFQDDGYTDEEHKMWNETHKMLDPAIKLTVTCVRVPVMVGHSEAINVEFEEDFSAEEARDVLREAPGIQVIDKRDDKGYITPKEAQGEFAVYVSRIREDHSQPNTLNMWVVSDNLRKGAALNAVQIAQLLVERGLLEKTPA